METNQPHKKRRRKQREYIINLSLKERKIIREEVVRSNRLRCVPKRASFFFICYDYGHGLAPNEEEYQTFPSAYALYGLQVDLDRPVIETSG